MEKNKDPLNDTVVDQFKNGNNELCKVLFADHPGQSAAADAGGGGGKGKGDVKIPTFLCQIYHLFQIDFSDEL